MSYTVDLLSRCLLADVDSSRYHVKSEKIPGGCKWFASTDQAEEEYLATVVE